MQPTTVQAQGIFDQYAKLCGLDSSGEPVMTDDFQPTIDLGVTLGKVFADNHDKYAKSGVVIGAENTGGPKKLLQAAFDSFIGNGSPANALILATALSAYWSVVAIVPKVAIFDLPSTVANDAATLIPAFFAAIMSTYTTASSSPFFVTLFDNIEKVIFTIKWTVIELKITPAGTVPAPPYVSTIT